MLNAWPEMASRSDRAAVWFASVLGAGRSKLAPGTVGTAATIQLYLLLAWLGSPAWYVGTTLGILVLGIAAAQRTSQLAGIADPGLVVIDETVGFLVPMTFVAPSVKHILLGFLVFRALDVVKPFGVRRLEAMDGGFGIMMDDFVAGVYGNVIVRLVIEVADGAHTTGTLVG